MLTRLVLSHPLICLVVVLCLNFTPLITRALHDRINKPWSRTLYLITLSLFGSFVVPLFGLNPSRQEYALAHYKIASIIGAILNTIVLLLLLGILFLPMIASGLNSLIGIGFMALVVAFALTILNSFASNKEDPLFWFIFGRMTK